MKTTNVKNTVVSFETLKTLLSCQPETKLDAKGYSEKNVLDFISLLVIHPPATVPGLLRLRKLPQRSLIGTEFLESEIFCPGSHEKLGFRVLLTRIIKLLFEDYLQNESSGYVLPFLKLTAKDENLLEQAGSVGEDFYAQVLRRIERKKIDDFHRNVNSYLAKIAARQNLDMKITLHSISKSLKDFKIPKISSLALMQRMMQRSWSDLINMSGKKLLQCTQLTTHVHLS